MGLTLNFWEFVYCIIMLLLGLVSPRLGFVALFAYLIGYHCIKEEK